MPGNQFKLCRLGDEVEDKPATEDFRNYIIWRSLRSFPLVGIYSPNRETFRFAVGRHISRQAKRQNRNIIGVV